MLVMLHQARLLQVRLLRVKLLRAISLLMEAVLSYLFHPVSLEYRQQRRALSAFGPSRQLVSVSMHPA